MSRMLTAFIVTPALLALIACAELTEPEPSEEAAALGRTSLVYTSDPDFKPEPGDFYAWLPEATRAYHDQRIPEGSVEGVMRDAIRTELGARGYRYTTSQANSDFLVGYTVALESALDDAAIVAKYGLQPGLVGAGVDHARYEKGTLIIYLVEPGRMQVVWRAALQGLVVLDLPPEMREPRVRAAVNRVLARLP